MTIFDGNVRIVMTLNTEKIPHTYETTIYLPKFNLFSAFVDERQVWYWQYNTKRSIVSFETLCDAYLDAEKVIL